jgi:hypothetical protein
MDGLALYSYHWFRTDVQLDMRLAFLTALICCPLETILSVEPIPQGNEFSLVHLVGTSSPRSEMTGGEM